MRYFSLSAYLFLLSSSFFAIGGGILWPSHSKLVIPSSHCCSNFFRFFFFFICRLLFVSFLFQLSLSFDGDLFIVWLLFLYIGSAPEIYVFKIMYKKIEIKRIEKDNSRQIAFSKRQTGLIKKL